MTVDLSGVFLDDTGAAIVGATVELYDVDTTTPARATDTTDANGQWDFNHATVGRFDVKLINGTDIIWLRARDKYQVSKMAAVNPTANQYAAEFTRTEDAASIEVALFEGNRANPAANDEIYTSYKLSDSAGNQDEFARITVIATDETTTTEDGDIEFETLVNGSLATAFKIGSSGVTGSIIKDEDNMSSNSATHLATQQSIKAYVDAQIATEDTIAELNDTNISSPAAGHLLVYDNSASVWDNAALSGGTGITATLGDGTLAVAIDSTVATLTGSQTLTNKSITAPTITGAVGGTQDSATITALTISSMAGNWTNASRTVADMGIVTTIDINGGTIDGAVIGGASAAAITGTTVTGTSLVGGTVAGTTGTFSGVVDITDTTDSSDATGDTGALRTEGGASIAKKLYVGTDASVGGNLTVTGNLNVDGTTTTVDSTTVAVGDSMILLAKDQGTSADAVDFGLYGKYGVGGTAKYAGIFRDLSATGDPWTFFDGLEAEPGTTVNTSGTGYDLADISAGGITAADGFTGDLTGNVTGNVSGTAATVTGATQSAITAVGTLGSVDIDGGAIDGVTLGTNSAVTQAVIDNININGTTIGHTSDTDLLTLTSANLAVAGDIEVSGSHSLEVATIDYTDGDLAMTIADGGGVTFAQDATLTSHKYLNLPENSSIKFTDQIGVDNSIDNDDGQGIIFTFRTGATVTPFSPVYIDGNNEVQECDADAIATMPCIGVSMNTSNVTADNDIEVMMLGLIRHDSFSDFGAAGAPVYVSTTAGALTTTAPSGTDDVVQIVGHSIAEDLIFVQPCLTTIEHA